MKQLFAVIKLNNKINIGTINNNKELTTSLHSDTLFKNEKDAVEYIENLKSTELLIIQPVYVTSTT
jgi:hypothetical protein